MRLSNVYVRFYKSFNFDYLRKYKSGSKQYPWEDMDGMWYPFVRVPVHRLVTTVVGANESGKSHLLSAIEKGITGEGISRMDFCRYSNFFKVERDKLKKPDFGFEWHDLSQQEREGLLSIVGKDASFDSFLSFRLNEMDVRVYLPQDGGHQEIKLNKTQAKRLQELMPHVFTIDPTVALPDTVPLHALAGTKLDSGVGSLSRKQRIGFAEGLLNSQEWFKTAQTVGANAQGIFTLISDHLADSQETDARSAQIDLARDLLCNVANVDEEAFSELIDAMKDGHEGHVNGIIQKINDRLESSLNFPNWWAQDKKFKLLVSPRESDLVFTIRDRTDTEYSFDERSSGLKYFLSYYVQYRAHAHEAESQILLMDEPDMYLSSQGQQDLLRVFQAFADPVEDERTAVQVVYVTHSPFLIDKNHADRIQVLEKGASDEGTRVVRDAARNHYEPLRSALGAFVGETAFIGNRNIVVEGLADQILLAGASSLLNSKGSASIESLDLNSTTIVPAGGASSVPYIVYLATGRDVEQPVITVLLDSDKSGDEAADVLGRGGPNGKRLIKEDRILQIGDLSELLQLSLPLAAATESEDLIPLEICASAAASYCGEVLGIARDQVKLTASDVEAAFKDGAKSTFEAVSDALSKSVDGSVALSKVGFARNVIATVRDRPKGTSEFADVFLHNMRVLFRAMNAKLRQAERETTGRQVSKKVERLKKAFLQDHPASAQREDALVLIESIEDALDDGLESSEIKLQAAELKRLHQLESDLNKPVSDYTSFKEKLEALQYAGRIATQQE